MMIMISVFGTRLGTQRQAQVALFVLLVCICLEIGGRPYAIRTPRHKVLDRLELTALLVLWGTMWCGTMIFTSQDQQSQGFVVFLSMLVVAGNLGTIMWLLVRLGMECLHEKRHTPMGKKIISVSRRTIGLGGSDDGAVAAADGGGGSSELGDIEMQEQQEEIRKQTVGAPATTPVLNPVLAAQGEHKQSHSVPDLYSTR